ncbi:Splicing factor U2AF 65 kDa subunit [Senna tora]|uniref:Splicing factor U2AF 65 kDa subunit n=1 Tax=Senna tora TaxID=362788 RepID=A0A834WF45_9FABA|nr:Splicing factor U2AF 65 kDa subunit [Senna tora]
MVIVLVWRNAQSGCHRDETGTSGWWCVGWHGGLFSCGGRYRDCDVPGTWVSWCREMHGLARPKRMYARSMRQSRTIGDSVAWFSRRWETALLKSHSRNLDASLKMISRPERLKEKEGKSNKLSVDTCDEESAARTRPFSLEEIMIRRKNRELLENVRDSVKEAWNISAGGSSENVADHFESGMIYKHNKKSSSVMEKHALEELEKVDSRKKVESTSKKEYSLTEGKEREDYYSETKLSTGFSNMGRIVKGSKTDKERHRCRKSDGRVTNNSEYEAENKHTRDSTHRDRYVEIDRQKSERTTKKKYQTGDDENPGEHRIVRKHDKDRYDRGKRKKWLSDDSEKAVEGKHHIDSASKDRHADSRGKYEREFKKNNKNEDNDKIQDRNAARRQDLGKHHDPENYERKGRQDRAKSYYEELRSKRRRSKSREREERRKSPSLSPKGQKRTHHDQKELPTLPVKNGSRKPHSDADRTRVATNGSSSHHHRHGGHTSGLGGYSPRKRKTEAAVKTPSPSKHSLEKKRAGWDLPPLGTDNSSAFQSSNITISSAIRDVAASTSVDSVIVKPVSVPLLNDSSSGKNTDIDSVQLTQATRPMRRLYLENLPASASEKGVMESLNNLLLSKGVNHIQGAQPCISCILHKDKGQALMEFLTAEDASAALSFDGSTLFGCTVKIRRPKDYVEVTVRTIQGNKGYLHIAMVIQFTTGEHGLLYLVNNQMLEIASVASRALYFRRKDLLVPLCFQTVAIFMQTGELERSVDAGVTNTISDVVLDSPDKIFIGGISKHLSSDMLMEIAGAFGSLKAYRFGNEYTHGHCAFLESEFQQGKLLSQEEPNGPSKTALKTYKRRPKNGDKGPAHPGAEQGIDTTVTASDNCFVSGFYHFGIRAAAIQGMVSTRMEARVDNLEIDMVGVKEDIKSMKELLQEMRATLGRIEGKEKTVGDEGASNEERWMVNVDKEAKRDKDALRYRKLEMPLFNGEDPIGWLFRVERYFSINGITTEEKLEAASVCLEGRALNWLQWMETRDPIQNWSDFKRELLHRFHHSQ